MPDICDLILDDHSTFRRRFAEMDEKRADPEALGRVWRSLGALLDLHAEAEEEIFYPRLVRRGEDGEEESTDAIRDHNKIRDAVAEARRREVGTDGWWDAVDRARLENSDHMAEEEREGLADFRISASPGLRDELGAQFIAFKEEHAGLKELEPTDKDPQGYVAEQAGE